MEQLLSTAIFLGPMVKDIQLLVNHGVQVYSFEFAYSGSMTLCDLFRLPPMKTFLNIFGRHTGMRLYRKSSLGVCHGDDLFYVFPFGMPGFPKPLKTPNDNKVSNPISIDSLFLLLDTLNNHLYIKFFR